ncbi:MAG: hypothetical protein FH753_01045 [Firmicutes bacterium]|nr:hypothetical protein [Bacillota bacterium]
MAKNTPYLDLYQKESTDINDTFNITTILNDNWDKIDTDSKTKDNRITAIEDDLNAPQYTPPIYNTSSIFSVGVGTDENGDSLDYSESVEKGQVSVGMKGLTVSQLIQNGDFSNGTTGWFINNGNTSTGNGLLQITGDGAGATIQLVSGNSNYLTNINGNKVFVACKVKINDNTNCNFIRLRLLNNNDNSMLAQEVISSPNATEYYELKVIATLDGLSDDFRIIIDVNYVSDTDANGKIFTINGNYGVFAIPMTANGIEDYTEEQMLEIVRGGYWEGTKSTISTRILTHNKNINNDTQDNGNYIEKYYDSSGNAISNNTYQMVENKRLPVISGKTISIGSDFGIGEVIAEFDINNNFIQRQVNTGGVFSLSQNTYYINFCIKKDSSPLTQDINVMIAYSDSIQSYVSHENSKSYIQLPQEIIDGGGMKSLPNGTNDEVKDGVLTQNVGNKKDVHSQTGWVINTTQTNTITFRLENYLTNAQDNLGNKNAILSIGAYMLTMNGSLISDDNDLEFSISNNKLFINIAKAKLSTEDVAGFESWLQSQGSSSLNYQLAEPKTYDLDITPLTVFENGTMIVEPFLPGKAITYDATTGNGLDFPHSVTEIEKIEDINGVKILEDDITLAEDGLSCTITGATDGEVYTVYAPIKPENSTIPTTVAKYVMNSAANDEQQNKSICQLSDNVISLQDQVAALVLSNS